MNEKEICHFASRYYCKILNDTQCCGNDKDCSFYKTETQYIADLQRAIKINRANGKCENCKYVITPCSIEEEKIK